jgi:hypothetical protein
LAWLFLRRGQCGTVSDTSLVRSAGIAGGAAATRERERSKT